ncbi:hypothetical protein MJG53_020101 [Ovis ammon polii x Ovis aries]|uniref:Uncharacterized protein n=2 Tax=Ovis TaxID=9935 RepID=A0A835ZGH7_SHEEP|nr:hypothetical protein JEQ12_020448 [Ovis aries]KAI4554802.1 hypothetical protein MJG53_020101 [Ovis ammon polii x Ovis aries]
MDLLLSKSSSSKKKLQKAIAGRLLIECVDLATFDAYQKNDKKNTEEKNSKQVSASEESDEMPVPEFQSVFVIPGSVLLWQIVPRPPNLAQMNNFTSFAVVLNEVDKEMESMLPKTDCRLRPDTRAMENREMDQASEEKSDLRNKEWHARTGPSQRTGRRGGSIKALIPTAELRTGFILAATGTETTSICLTFTKM